MLRTLIETSLAKEITMKRERERERERESK
jgi:hypothetical protein